MIIKGLIYIARHEDGEKSRKPRQPEMTKLIEAKDIEIESPDFAPFAQIGI